MPADWFYEWQKTDAKDKQPFAIAQKDHAMFVFASFTGFQPRHCRLTIDRESILAGVAHF